ncbi:Conserved_hypothetical protein [Hexamita inflata]|uniref:Uncharacterized protein n=1 Tax=Hexamita inflata TaxID=28002 RepID=A0AA86PS29_9EUKA|nr:Conserved hypothetical protein [Hexamita inflata]
MEDLDRFKEFIIQKYKYVDLESFVQQEYDSHISRQIQCDINRGMWRFKDILQCDKMDMCAQMQTIFNVFFCKLWHMTCDAIFTNYFQGITDVFELVFISFIQPQSLNLLLQITPIESIDFSLIFESPPVIFNYCLQILDQLYQTPSGAYVPKDCPLYELNTVGAEVLNFIQKFDAQSQTLISIVTPFSAQSLLLKYTLNNCLHVAKTLKMGICLAQILLSSDQVKQGFIIQNLFSASARIYAPLLFTIEADPVFDVKYHLFVNSGQNIKEYSEQVFDCVNNAIMAVLDTAENEDIIIQYVNELSEDYEKLKKRKPFKYEVK